MSDPIRLPVRLDGQTDKGPIIWEQAAPGWEDRKLEVTVIFTTTPGTLAALRLAGQYARDLGGGISILVVQVVPYPLPLERPSSRSRVHNATLPRAGCRPKDRNACTGVPLP